MITAPFSFTYFFLFQKMEAIDLNDDGNDVMDEDIELCFSHI